jgi:nucleoside phosphorylase
VSTAIRKATGLLSGLAVLLTVAVAGPAAATSPAARCQQRVLVLSAMPLELNPLVRGAALTATRSKDGHIFYEGRLQGVDVLLAMTGIGPANAARTTEAALGVSSCAFRAAVFSGVAGSRGFIGDVAVPRRWTSDNGKSWHRVDAAMLRVSRSLDAKKLKLIQDVPVGDAACACPGVDAPTPVHLPQAPVLRVGGDGTTSDPFGGRAVPCVPGGGDIAGCEPCLTLPGTVNNAGSFATEAARLAADPGFFPALLQPPAATTSTADAQDEETDAVLQVATKHRLPFLGIRAVSDGQGDPLGLPGFPVQFAVYRQLAANNAATVTMAFLQSWRVAGLPTST